MKKTGLLDITNQRKGNEGIMNMSPVQSCTLSQEELFIILAYLGKPLIAGLNSSFLKSLSEEQRKIVFGVAERALIARGILVKNGKEFKLVSPTLSLVGACANSDAMIVMNFEQAGQPPEACFFHVAQGLHVMHILPYSTIHQFIAYENIRALTQKGIQLLNIGKPTTIIVPGGDLPENALEKAKKAALEKKPKDIIVPLLTNSGLDSRTAEEFATAIANPLSSITIMRLIFSERSEKRDSGFVLLKSDNGLWMLKPVTPGEQKNRQVSIKSITIEQAEQTMIALFDGISEASTRN